MTMCTRTSSRAAIMPSGSCTPVWSSRMNSCGSRCRISRSSGRGMARALSTALRSLVAANLARPGAKAETAVAVDAANMGAGHAQQRVLDGRSRDVFGLLHRLLNRAHGFVQIDDDALARAARFGDAVTAIAQSVVGNLRHQRAGLGAAYVDCGQKMLVLVRHSYCVSPLAIAGLGFADAFTAATDFGAGLVLAPGVFAAAACLAFALALLQVRAGRTRALRCAALAVFALAAGRDGAGFATDVATGFAVKAGDGLGAELMRVISAAGFTPAAMAFLAASAESGGCFIGPCKSGLTMICRS